ncbi:MAG: hypothetical protein IPL17_21910 [Anaerolineales bacterium]|nr:hypothetical protein [Anaerolineales bacterium]
MLGPMAGVRGFWMAAGMSLNGYGGAGGMGKLIAEWIIDGEAPMDVYSYRATRFGNYYSDPVRAWTERRKCEILLSFALPHDEHENALPHRVGPFTIVCWTWRGIRRKIWLGARELFPAWQTVTPHG